jgi:outer membrane protein OmpA-like peptidoglycan-associated protein
MVKESALSPVVMTSGRLVRRTETAARAPFLPFGLIPVGALVLLLLFGLTFFSRSVEDAVARTAQRALDDAGASWATARVSGQWVTLEGAPPSREQAARALAAVRDARTGVLLGQAIPATRVGERFVWVGDLAEPASAAASPTSAPDATPEPSAPGPQVDLVIPPAAQDACNQSLAALLDTAKIEFAPSSAVIARSNSSLLDSLASAAAVCPGAVRIEGHTDSSGSATFNRNLSLHRAEAVRAALIERGLAPRRVFIEGFGASRPLADNATDEGRERNRRIEIRMAPAPT